MSGGSWPVRMTRPTLLKILKGLAFAGGGLVAVLALVAFVAAMLFDGEFVKTEAAKFMAEEKHRSLRIEGEVRLNFWPPVGLTLSKASLSERYSEKPFASVGRVRLALRLLPLLRKELAVDTVELEGVSINVVRNVDGSFNFQDLLSAEKDKPPLKFDIAGLSIGKAKLDFLDQMSGQKLALADLDLSSGRLANASEGKLNLSTHFTMAEPAVDVVLQGEGYYRLDLDKGRFGVDGLSVRGKGDLAQLKAAEFLVAVDQLVTGYSGVDLTKTLFNLKSQAEGKSLEAKLELPLLKLAGARFQVPSLSLSLSRNEARQLLTLNGSLAELERDGDFLKAKKLEVQMSQRQGGDSFLARLNSPLEANLKSPSFALSTLAGELELDQSALPKKQLVMTVKGTLQADFAKPMAALNLDARFDESHALLRLDASRFAPPAITFNVVVDRINGDHFIPKPATQAEGQGAAKDSGKAKEFALPPGVDASGHIRIGRLMAVGLKADNLQLDLSIKDGRLEWSPLAQSLIQSAVGSGVGIKAPPPIGDLGRQVGSKLKSLIGQ